MVHLLHRPNETEELSLFNRPSDSAMRGLKVVAVTYRRQGSGASISANI